MSYITKIKTYYQLGLFNLLAVAIYRITIKLNFFVKTQPINNQFLVGDNNDFFVSPNISASENLSIPQLKGFGWIEIPTDSAPNWLTSIKTGKSIKNNASHWSLMGDFDLNIGDVKTVWELSRFDWLLHFTVRYLKTGDVKYINKINLWLNSWCADNPINQGVNWKCGQEASIRVIHICTALLLLQQTDKISPALSELLKAHLSRISPTRFYAMAQDNNHGTSEAAALYIGGAILSEQSHFSDQKLAQKWHAQGQYWLENRVSKLIESDGAFSQYSVNYHRLMLDTLSITEAFRQALALPTFSHKYYRKCRAASSWLFACVEPNTGDAPIIGANDGAKLLPLSNTDYRDYRPSVQLAYGLFKHEFPYPKKGEYHQPSALIIKKEYEIPHTISDVDNALNSSVHKITFNDNWVFIKTPVTSFRPSSCDALHIDFWLGRHNILRDAGSYSYNCEEKWLKYFSSTAAHNTVQFDDEEQMPKLSRFLYAHWINSNTIQKNAHELESSYKNAIGHSHLRHLSLSENTLTISDTISGFNQHATMRLRLAPIKWEISNNVIKSDLCEIHIDSDCPEIEIKLVDGFESRYYLQKSEIPVVEITIKQAGSITTKINWAS